MESSWRPRYEFPDLRSAEYVAFDTETFDPELDTKGPGGVRGVGQLVGVSVAVPGWSNYYPIAHQGGDNLPADVVLRWLRQTMATDVPKVAANFLYDAEWLAVNGITIGGEWHDIIVREALINENLYSYDADSIFARYLGVGKEHELLLAYGATQGHRTERAVKQNLWRYPARYVGPYAEMDAVGALKVYAAQEETIAQLGKVYALEKRVTKLLFKMRMRGIPVDIARAERSMAELDKFKKEAQALVNTLAGYHNVDVWSGQSIAKAFGRLGLDFPRTAKGNGSFTAEWLEEHTHEFPRAIVQVRKLDRAGNVFIRKKIVDVTYGGRIFPVFKQTRAEEGGTRSGRLASSNPNIQQVPARNKVLAPLIRSIFVPDQGYQWGVFDYSQQEPRITVHYAALRGFRGADEARSRYQRDPSTDYHALTRDLVFEKSNIDIGRSNAKTINLGLTYTMGGAKLCRRIGLPTKWIPHWRDPERLIEVAGEEGQAILDAYHKGMPFIRELMEDAGRIVKRRGYIITAGGRHCHLEPHRAHIAINRLVQGTAADMTKLAMVNLDDAGYTPYLQAHDEVDNPVEKIEDARAIEDIMIATAVDMGITVPMKVDIELGPSWGEAKEI